MPVQTIIKLRRDTAANWTSTNPVLAAGEAGFESDSGLIKYGDGTSTWTALSYSSTSSIRTRVLNQTGSPITKGSVVYISGANGDNPLITLADADTEATSSKTIGLVDATIANGAIGYVIEAGLLTGLNTAAATAGQSVWLSSTAGEFVYGAPPAKPAHSVYLGVVIRAQLNNGAILVKVQNGYELNELHDVDAGSPTTGQALAWNGSMWTAQTISASVADATPTVAGKVFGTTSSASDRTTALGFNALNSLTTGVENTALGFRALLANTSGSYNVGIGYEALVANTTGNQNTAISPRALRNNTTGLVNIAIGFEALESNTTGQRNIALGNSALISNTTGSDNIALGRSALVSSINANNNIAIGTTAAYLLTSGSDSVYIGYEAAGVKISAGSNNVAIGSGALYANVTAGETVAIGYRAGRSGGGVNNTILGNLAGLAITTGAYNVSSGSRSLENLTTGAANVAIGGLALTAITTSNSNTAIGYAAMQNVSSGLTGSIAIGRQAMQNKSGNYSIAIGFEALSASGGASNTIAIGTFAGQAVTGQYNVIIGDEAGIGSTTTTESILIGRSVQQVTGSTAIGSTIIGHFAAGNNAVTGNYNTVIGHLAGVNISSGGGNVFVGRSAGGGVSSGVNNVLIGNEAGNIGSNFSNRLYIANSNTTTPLIYGEFNTSLIRINGKLEVTGGLDAVQTVETKSSSFSLAAEDAGKLILNSAAITVTVGGLVAGEQVDFLQSNAAQITFAAGAGVTLSSKGGNLKTAAQGSPATIKCVAANTYWLIGDLGA